MRVSGFRIGAGFLIMLLVMAGVVLPLSRPTNCGGNSAALTACKSTYLLIRTIGLDRGREMFDLFPLLAEEAAFFESVPGLRWLPGARLFVRTNELRIGSSKPKQVLVVCDMPYNNVPQRLLGRAPLAHAVCYSDGSKGLITPKEFRALDLRRFVDVGEVRTRSRAEPAVKPAEIP